MICFKMACNLQGRARPELTRRMAAKTGKSNPDPQALLIDADDTLWENNIYFEQSIADFMSFLNHQQMTHDEVRLVINQAEHETILERGYGYHSFAHSLVKTFERLSPEPVTPYLPQRIRHLSHPTSTTPTTLIPSAHET